MHGFYGFSMSHFSSHLYHFSLYSLYRTGQDRTEERTKDSDEMTRQDRTEERTRVITGQRTEDRDQKSGQDRGQDKTGQGT